MDSLEANSLHTPRKNWWQRNWKWFVPTGCVTLIALFAIFIFSVFFAVTGIMKQSTPYTDAFTAAQNNAEVIAVLGEPLEQSGMLQGNISIQNNTGEANISIPIEGPNGKAIIYVIGTKYSDEWTYDKMTILIKSSQQTIDLLEE